MTDLVFNLQKEEQDLLPFDLEGRGLNPVAARDKASRVKVALGDKVPEEEELASRFEWDREDESYREMVRLDEEEKLLGTQGNLLEEILSSAGADPSDSVESFKAIAGFDSTSLVTNKQVNLEKAYAQNMFNFVAAATENPNFKENYNVVSDVLAERATDELAFQSVVDEYLIGNEKRDTNNPVEDTVDFLSEWIPFVAAARMMNEVEQFDAESILPGFNMKEQYDFIMSLPLEERVPVFKETVERLEESSQDAARRFAQAFKYGYTNSDALADTAGTTGFDLVDVATLGGAKLVSGTARASASFTKGIVKGAAIPNGKPLKNIAEEVGDFSSSTSAKMEEVFSGAPRGLDEIRDSAVGIFNPSRLVSNQTTLDTTAFNKVMKAQLDRGNEALDEILKTPSIQRINSLELRDAVRSELDMLTRDFTSHNHNVVDVSDNYIKGTNTSTVSVSLGKKNGELFDTEAQATNWANRWVKLRTDDYEVVPHGDKYVVQVTRDVDESKGILKADLEIPTDEKINDSIANSLLAGIRTPRDLLSKSNFEDRGLAQHGSERLKDIFQNLVAPEVDKLRKGEKNNLVKMLEHQRDSIDPTTKRRGYYFKDSQEFEQEYYRRFKELPTIRQVAANFAYRQAMDAEYFMRTLGRYRDHIRVGARELTFNYSVKGKRQAATGKAKQVDSLPLDGTADFRLAVIGKDGKPQIYEKRFIPQKVLEKLEGKDIFKSIEQPFKFGDKNSIAHYVVSDASLKNNRISLKQLEYNPGGHVVDKYSNYIKQPILRGKRTKYYLGDNTFMNAYTPKQANELVSTLERARKSLREGTDEWKRIVDTEMPWTSRTAFEGLFKEKFDIDTPFVYTRAGVRTKDSSNLGDVVDSAENGLDELSALDRKFATERGNVDNTILKAEEDGSYKISRSPKIDPLEALNLGVRSAIDNNLQKDYVFKSLNQFQKSFEDILKVSRDEIYNNPIKTLHRDDLYVEGVAPGRRRIAEATRKAILRQVGQATVEGEWLNTLRTKVAESFAPGGRKFELAETHLLPIIKDPFVYARSIAFNLKLGLFNVLQLPVQAQTLTHLLALSPKHAYPSMSAAWAMQALRLTDEPGIIKHFAKAAMKVHSGKDGMGRMTADQFQESYEALRRSGWDRVGGDVAQLDDVLDPELFRSGTKKFIDSGKVFFNGIERYLRLSGWNTAYLEWRALNPTAQITDDVIGKLISRADDLTVNMSAMNNAVWQKGLLGIPAQFASYQIRLMEQMWPAILGRGRIDADVAARAFATYSAMYGIGFGGLGATIGGVAPAGDIIRKEFEQRGIDVQNANPFIESFMDGVPSVLFEMLSGYDLDFAQRYGPGGFDGFQELMAGERPWWEFAFGAAGSVTGNLLEAGASTVATGYYSAFNVEDNQGMYAVQSSDILDVFKEASSVKFASDLYLAWNYGKWITRRGTEMSDLEELEATIARILGVTPTEINYAWVRQNILRDEQNSRSGIRREALKYYRRALRELENNNIEEYNASFRRARAILIGGGYNNMDSHKILREAMSEDTITDSTLERWRKDVVKWGERDER